MHTMFIAGNGGSGGWPHRVKPLAIFRCEMFPFHQIGEFKVQLHADGFGSQEYGPAWGTSRGVIEVDRHTPPPHPKCNDINDFSQIYKSIAPNLSCRIN
ncbi:hypothetical protein NQ318_017104 [Aromia moschata]|uniref:Uncharacterized protein n=1 Tax=Aromia moschata TaxID=1265417 RepID=A0AAV8Y4C4_9CUCU|nr:hypothetical protein NQ318_017104 [Aromia moschata]